MKICRIVALFGSVVSKYHQPSLSLHQPMASINNISPFIESYRFSLVQRTPRDSREPKWLKNLMLTLRESGGKAPILFFLFKKSSPKATSHKNFEPQKLYKNVLFCSTGLIKTTLKTSPFSF